MWVKTGVVVVSPHRPLVLLEDGLEAEEGDVEDEEAQAGQAKAQHGSGAERRVEAALEPEALGRGRTFSMGDRWWQAVRGWVGGEAVTHLRAVNGGARVRVHSHLGGGGYGG